MNEETIAEDIRAAAIRAADEYRYRTGDNAFNLTFDGTMELLGIAIQAERDRLIDYAESVADGRRKQSAGARSQKLKVEARDFESMAMQASQLANDIRDGLATSIRQGSPK